MIPLSSAAAALSAAVLVWLSALPEPRSSSSHAANAARDDAILSRVEREVVELLRERAEDRWRFSRVHRPTPVHRTEPDAARSNRRHAAFRVLVTEPRGGAERVGWLVRVDRASGTIEFAPPPPSEAAVPPRWQPLADVLPRDLLVRTND